MANDRNKNDQGSSGSSGSSRLITKLERIEWNERIGEHRQWFAFRIRKHEQLKWNERIERTGRIVW